MAILIRIKLILYISILLLIFGVTSIPALSQKDSLKKGVSFKGDFRFRAEHDWESMKSDGTLRDDRTRFRYRLRAGIEYKHKSWATFGARIRTGNPKKQQDPQLTFGDGVKEFGTLPIGLEKLYFKASTSSFSFWIGKNSFPFKQNHELFWSGNVFPEGVSLKKGIIQQSENGYNIDVRGGYFIIDNTGRTLATNGHFHAYQVYSSLFNNRVQLFPSFYFFKNIQNVPDGGDTYRFDYSIFQIGTSFNLLANSKIHLELDYLINLENYTKNDSIPLKLKNEKEGVVIGLGYGQLKKKKDWTIKVSATYLERYAAIDFLSQNDWVRWDYSSAGSPDGRLTNLKGFELVVGYLIDNNMSVKMKYYMVEQLIPYGIEKETGNRIRFDLDFSF